MLAKALDDGLDQIVLLGAGFDARALRIPGIAAHGARVYEIDLPEQIQRKVSLLADAEVALPRWVSYVACDLTAPDYEDALARMLDEVGFKRDRGTLFIWEGVTTYIGVTATDRALRFLATIGAPESRVVFDVGAHFFGRETVSDHAVKAGFTSCEAYGCDELWRRYLTGEPHPAAGVFCMALALR